MEVVAVAIKYGASIGQPNGYNHEHVNGGISEKPQQVVGIMR